MTTPFVDIESRIQRTRTFLKGYLAPTTDSPLESAIAYLLQTQRSDGSWGSADYLAWTDVITALVVQALTACGFSRRSSWEINSESGGPVFVGGVAAAANYLKLNQKSTGWGEDTFDTCQVAKALLGLGEDALDAEHLRDILALLDLYLENADTGGRSEWEGSGVFAAIVDVSSIAGNRALQAKAMDRLVATQCPDEGYYGPASSSTGLKVWHTANAVLALHGQGMPLGSPALDHAVSWLMDHQNSDGTWGDDLIRHRTIFTSYGAMALAAIQGASAPIVVRALAWLRATQNRADGSVGGMEGTVMAALAFARGQPKPTVSDLPLTELVTLDTLLGEAVEVAARLGVLTTESADLRTALNEVQVYADQEHVEADESRGQVADLSRQVGELTERLRAEDDKYMFRLTNRRAGQIGFALGLLGLTALPGLLKDCGDDGNDTPTPVSISVSVSAP